MYKRRKYTHFYTDNKGVPELMLKYRPNGRRLLKRLLDENETGLLRSNS